ncbi:MAG TPA: cytochrome c peroxidase [Dongiaceae bacterium]|nr:cytochrome c peroxidase [Dongiaceae bacterium]
MKSRATLRLLATVLICTWLPTMTWGAVPPAALFNKPLNQVPVPEPANLFQFVKNKPAAIKLGKALFWDMQVGSDGVQACASCHFSAGADNRLKNTVNPGTRRVVNGVVDTIFKVRGPNEILLPTDFPFHQRNDPTFQNSLVIRDANDVVGSQGVKLTDFVAINTDINTDRSVDIGTPAVDPVFQVGGANMRRVTARNTPSVINAVFNFNNFWDGRAHFIFNGVNPFGPQDTSAKVLFSDPAGNLTPTQIQIEMAGLASQATGPPLDSTEMSFGGRTFPQLGRKMLSLTPLGKQVVHPNDSVLGPLSRAVLQGGKLSGQPGLSITYDQMIRDAFQDTFYKSSNLTNGFTQMEMNFSLFWGLAIQLYEATLVSDQTRFDRLLGGDGAAITPQEESGMNDFFGVANCFVCHGGTELTSASVAAAAFLSNAENRAIEQMQVASGLGIYDQGFNSTSVRPVVDDIGRGGDSPFPNPLLAGQFIPLSFSAMAKLQAQVPSALPFPSLAAGVGVNIALPVTNNGAFKVPGLRNVELTAPYFHNGSVLTLDDVVDFYVRGGNFPALADSPHLDPLITQIGALQGPNAITRRANLVAFMKTLTDERVRNQSAPFDHPELVVPNGDPDFIRIPARDASGNVGVTPPVTISQVNSLTNNKNFPVSGLKDLGSIVQVTVNNGPAVTADSPSATTWSAALSGLVEGLNNIAVSGTDAAGLPVTVTTTLTLDSIPPALTIIPITAPIRGDDFLLAGTVEAGIAPVVSVKTGAVIGTANISGSAWSVPLSLLNVGANDITVTATDKAGNVASATASIFVLPDGIFNGTKIPDVSDAIKALRIAVGLVTPTANDMLHGDVAPLGAPDGKIDLADVVLIMRNVVGSINLAN